jgi:hypothetical protein
MRGRRTKVVLTVVAAALAGTAGVAVADPVPRPHGVAGKGNAATWHAVGRRGHHHVRPRTVVRCQNDDTEQIDEFDNDGGEPLHHVSPGTEAAGGRCPGAQDALGIADILAGGHRTRARVPARR